MYAWNYQAFAVADLFFTKISVLVGIPQNVMAFHECWISPDAYDIYKQKSLVILRTYARLESQNKLAAQYMR